MSIRNAMSLPDDIPRHPLGVPERVKREEAEAAKRRAEKEKRPAPTISDPRYVITPQGGVAPRDYRLVEADNRRSATESPSTDPLRAISVAQLMQAFVQAQGRGATLEEAQACLRLVERPRCADQRRLGYRMLQRLKPGAAEVEVSKASALARGVPSHRIVDVIGTWDALHTIELLDAMNPTEDMLPEGVTEGAPGEYLARCCSCGQDRPLFGGLDEVPLVGYQHWCGGSDRCCP